ncbi:MAG: hypothetical protein E7359_00535 [Clostridiales bacterium]|nr:hypothetical protein [Clostridiales bacterium]
MIEIFTDLFDIVKKIKYIDNNYRVFRNITKHRFEIYYQNGLNLNLELILPYNNLDYRAINLINKSRVENADELFDYVDNFNDKLGLKE